MPDLSNSQWTDEEYKEWSQKMHGTLRTRRHIEREWNRRNQYFRDALHFYFAKLNLGNGPLPEIQKLALKQFCDPLIQRAKTVEGHTVDAQQYVDLWFLSLTAVVQAGKTLRERGHKPV